MENVETIPALSLKYNIMIIIKKYSPRFFIFSSVKFIISYDFMDLGVVIKI